MIGRRVSLKGRVWIGYEETQGWFLELDVARANVQLYLVLLGALCWTRQLLGMTNYATLL